VTGEEAELQAKVDVLVKDSEAMVSGRDVTAIMKDTGALEKRIQASSISDAAKKRMLDSLKDVNSGLTFEKYSGKLLHGGLITVMVIPVVISFLEGVLEYLTRATITPEMVDLAGMAAVVTGGCGAVGIELAILLAESGARVFLGCRGAATEDTEASGSALDAEERILQAGVLKGEETAFLGSVQIWHLDLTSFENVRTFAQRVVDQVEVVDILVHSAATRQGCNRTMDEHEIATQVNYLSPYLLNHLLTPHLREGTARVVHTTCDAGLTTTDWLPWPLSRTTPETLPKLDFRGLEPRKEGKEPNSVAGECNAYAEYANAKLAIVVYSHELNRRLNLFSSIGTSHVVNPGPMNNTFGMGETGPPAKASWWSTMMGYFPPVWIGKKVYHSVASSLRQKTLRTSKVGAKAIFHVATSPVLNGAENGGRLYSDTAGAFTNCRRAANDCGTVSIDVQPPAASDRDLATTLWARTGHAIGRDTMRPLRAQPKLGTGK
jgi:NAD(P)-dependent dehydrogenase (short-subunit alcohol dehydrogenase family)